MDGSPNEQVWQIFDESMNVLGSSQFHISCSDKNMNGVEDCNKDQGNGKKDDPGLIDTWLLEAIIGDDGTLDCTPPPPPPIPPVCGLGPLLALVMPPLLWLQQRRRSR